MAAIEYVKGTSFFHRLDPRVKIISLLIFVFFIFTTKDFLIISVLFALILVLWFTSRLPVKRLLRLFKLLIPLFFFIIVIQAIFQVGDTILVQPIIPAAVPVIGGAGRITLEGLLYGLVLCYRLVTLIIMMPLITMTTQVNQLTIGLVKLGLPYRIAYMATTALNMIPSLEEQVKTIMDAQKLRAFTVFEEGKMREKLVAYPTLVIPMVISAMKKAMLVGVAMDARAFACKKTRTYVETLRFTATDAVALTAFILLIAGLAVLNFIR